MLEIQVEDYKYFLWEYKNEKTLYSLAEKFYDTFKIDKSIHSYILDIKDENEARQEIFKKFLLH